MLPPLTPLPLQPFLSGGGGPEALHALPLPPTAPCPQPWGGQDKCNNPPAPPHGPARHFRLTPRPRGLPSPPAMPPACATTIRGGRGGVSFNQRLGLLSCPGPPPPPLPRIMSPLCGSVCLFLRGGGGQPPPLFASSSGAGRAPPVPALPRAPPGSSSPPHPQRSGVPCPPPPHPGRWAPQSLHGAEGPPPGSRAPPLPPHIYLTPQLSVCSAQVCWGGGRGGLHPLTPHPPPGRAALPVSSHHPPLLLLLVPVPAPPPPLTR